MAKKIGKCINIDCENYKKEVEVAAGEEFECPACHQHLEEVTGGGGGGDNEDKKKKIIIAAAAVVLLGGGAGLYFGLSGDDKAKNAPETEVKAPVDSTAIAKPDTTAAKQAEEKPVVEEPKKEEAKTEATTKKSETTKPAQPQNGHGTVNLGYGRYTGDLKNGQPHGHGTITYTQSHKIVNSKDFVASPGDTFEGDFREGRISSIGYWMHDGNMTAVKP